MLQEENEYTSHVLSDNASILYETIIALATKISCAGISDDLNDDLSNLTDEICNSYLEPQREF